MGLGENIILYFGKKASPSKKELKKTIKEKINVL
jgi:hypothetical protein